MKIDIKDFEHAIRSAKNNKETIFTNEQIKLLKTIFRFECDKILTEKIEKEELVELPYKIGSTIYLEDYETMMINEIKISCIEIYKVNGNLEIYAFDTNGNGGLVSGDNKFFSATRKEAEQKLNKFKEELK